MRILLLITSALILNGCFGLIAATSATTGMVIAKDKTVGNTVDDFAIRTKIHNDLFRRDANSLFNRVNVKVSEGKVLLMGYVTTPEDRMEAVRIAWSQDGVVEVINEIQIDNFDKFEIGEYSKDAWITTNIKTKLLFNQNIKSINYNIETIKGVVYIIGLARSQHELELVNSIASRVRFVKKVISHVRVKDSVNSADQIEYNQGYDGSLEKTHRNHRIDAISSKELSSPEPKSPAKPSPVAISSPETTAVDDGSGMVEEFDSFDD